MTGWSAAWLLALASASLKGGVVLLMAFALARLLRRQSSSLRYGILLAAFASQIAILTFGALLPRWHVMPWRAPSLGQTVNAPPQIVVSDAPTATPDVAATAIQREARRVPALLIFGFWVLGFALVAARLIRASVASRRLLRRAKPICDQASIDLMHETAHALGVTRHVALLEDPSIRTPVAVGILNPAVVVPVDARLWSPQRRRAVLLHELAHVYRFDLFALRSVELVTAIFWFSPMVWIAAATLRLERERACDDIVLHGGVKASSYVHDLLGIAGMVGPMDRATPDLAFVRVSDLEQRLLALLDGTVSRRPLSRRAIVLSTVMSCVAVAPLAVSAPRAASHTPSPSPQRKTSLATPFTPVVPSRHAAAIETSIDVKVQVQEDARGDSAVFSCPFRGGSHINWTETTAGATVWRVGWSGPDCEVAWRSEGEIRFTADGGAIAFLGPDASVTLRGRDLSGAWSLVARPSNAGISEVWSRDGVAPSPLAARSWLAGFLREVDKQEAIPR